MGIFEQFPYTNFHDLNLDWILHAIQSMDKKLDEFVASNVLSYADPIQWDIETQYAKNTVVIDPKTGTAYMSIKPVPAGQLLTNKYYWQPIFNYDEIVNTLKKQIAAVQADQYDTIPVAVGRGDLVWVANKLYRLTKSLDAGNKIIENENAVPVTVEELIAQEISDRDSAVTALDERITQETTARENADTALDERITQETTARENADTEINNNIINIINAINSMPYINVTLHGVKNDGTDTTEDIKNVINQFPQHVLFFPDGTYGVSEPIKIDNDINKRVCLKLSEMATIKALDNFTGDFLVDLYYKGTESGINIGKTDLESFGIMGGFYNCNNKCSGIHIGKTHDTYIMNVNIYKCTNYGIKIDDPFDYPSADAWLFDIIIRGYADKTIGLYINAGDNNICRLRTWDTNIGMWVNRGFNTFNHIHVLCSAYDDLTQEQYEKTVGIVLNGGDCYNNVFTDCYTDNFNIGIHCVSCGNNIFTRLYALCNDDAFSTQKIGILVDDFYRLTINSFTFSAKQSGAVSVSVPNYSWFNTGDLTSFGYIDHRFFVEGDTAKLDIYNDASMFSPFNRIYDYNIGNSGQDANTYRLIAVVRASNIPYSFKVNGYSISCDINIMLDINNTFKLNSIKSYLDRNPTSKIAIGLIGEHFGRNLYGIYIVSYGSAYYNIKFDYLAADQLVLIPPRAIANYNDDFKDKQSITELFAQELVNYPN